MGHALLEHLSGIVLVPSPTLNYAGVYPRGFRFASKTEHSTDIECSVSDGTAGLLARHNFVWVVHRALFITTTFWDSFRSRIICSPPLAHFRDPGSRFCLLAKQRSASQKLVAHATQVACFLTLRCCLMRIMIGTRLTTTSLRYRFRAFLRTKLWRYVTVLRNAEHCSKYII